VKPTAGPFFERKKIVRDINGGGRYSDETRVIKLQTESTCWNTSYWFCACNV